MENAVISQLYFIDNLKILLKFHIDLYLATDKFNWKSKKSDIASQCCWHPWEEAIWHLNLSSFSRYISTRTGARRFNANSAPLPLPVTSAWSFTCAATSTSPAQTSRWKRSWPPTRRARAPWWVTAARQTWGVRRRPRCIQTLSSRYHLRLRPPPITSTSRRSRRKEICPCSPPSACAGTGPAVAPTLSTYPESGSGLVPVVQPQHPSSAPTSALRQPLTCLWSSQVSVLHFLTSSTIFTFIFCGLLQNTDKI